MPPNITQVDWRYGGWLPSGLSFNEQTGTFSGTPTKGGEYTVPVSVRTNYGEDTKDVKICVWPHAFNAYVIGFNAGQISNNAPPNEHGLRKLSIPPISMMQYCIKSNFGYDGFVALCADGNYYIYGQNMPIIYKNGSVISKSFSTPTILTDSYGFRYGFRYCRRVKNTSAEKEYIYSDAFWSIDNTTLSIYKSNNTSPEVLSISNNELKHDFPRDFFSGYTFLSADNKTWYENEEIFNNSFTGVIKKYAYLPFSEFSTRDPRCYYMFIYYKDPNVIQRMHILVLDEIGNLVNITTNEVLASGVKNFWAINRTSSDSNLYVHHIFIQKYDGSFWVKGTLPTLWVDFGLYKNNNASPLGLGDIYDTNDEFVYIGEYDEIKTLKIANANIQNGVFILTETGKLYYTGNNLFSSVISSTKEFTRVFPEYNIKDIEVLYYGGPTLILTLKE